MAYDKPFYLQYEEDYINDPNVRVKHDALFEIIRANQRFSHVVDFGCGSSTEFARFAKPESYIGFDLTDTPIFDPSVTRVQADYRQLEAIRFLCDGRAISAGVSLFSAELFASPEENAAFYSGVFKSIDGLGAILAGGIHYQDRLGEIWVSEEGGIRSRQTFSKIEPAERDAAFDEFRFTLPNPSRMFGECTEVLRLLFKKGQFNLDDAQMSRQIKEFQGITEIDTTLTAEQLAF